MTMTPYQEHQEEAIARARRIYPDDVRLEEASGDDEIRSQSYALACEILDEAL